MDSICTAALVSSAELPSDFVCRCHAEDLLRWSLYSGDYVVLRGSDSDVCYAVVNPPLEDGEASDCVKEGEVLVAPKVFDLLGGGIVHIEMKELEEASSVRLSGIRDEETLQQLQSFFGTVAGQSDRTLQDVADEEDLDVDEEVLEYWQGYVQKSRCAMTPVWTGLSFGVAAEATICPIFKASSWDVSHVSVTSILASDGSRMESAVVGPQTRLLASNEDATCAAPAA
eukprot:s2997_g9.t1